MTAAKIIKSGLKRLLIVPALASFFAASAGTALAELMLEAAGWQGSRVSVTGASAVWQNVERWQRQRLPRLRGKVVLKNRGPKPAEAVLLRYSVSARLVPDRAVAAEAAWSLPILVDERRVPKIGPNQVVDIPLSLSPKLEHYFKKLRRQGLRANALKIQAMLEPNGADGVRVVEANLEVGS